MASLLSRAWRLRLLFCAYLLASFGTARTMALANEYSFTYSNGARTAANIIKSLAYGGPLLLHSEAKLAALLPDALETDVATSMKIINVTTMHYLIFPGASHSTVHVPVTLSKDG